MLNIAGNVSCCYTKEKTMNGLESQVSTLTTF